MKYKIISTGSKGNALILNDALLIDCGVTFKKLKDYYKKLKVVLLTHIHSDHFNKTTIKQLTKERPTLRFGCCKWLVRDLLECGVKAKNIDVFKPGIWYNYNIFKISPVLLYHNVEQCGYRIIIDNKKCIYCTDTNTLDGIKAKNYDYYFIEANFEEEEMKERIKAKELLGQYAYEKDAILNHLSKEKCDAWLFENVGDNSQYFYMHRHEEKEKEYGKQ